MELDSTTLGELATNVWESMLGMELIPGMGEPLADAGKTLTGCVQITGAWHGAVTLRCTANAAAKFAEAMFGCPASDLSLEEIRDALGELSNMTAGSVKGCLEGTCHLGIPAVAEGLDYLVTVPRAKEISTVHFTVDGSTLEIAVFEGA